MVIPTVVAKCADINRKFTKYINILNHMLCYNRSCIFKFFFCNLSWISLSGAVHLVVSMRMSDSPSNWFPLQIFIIFRWILIIRLPIEQLSNCFVSGVAFKFLIEGIISVLIIMASWFFNHLKSDTTLHD